MYKIYLDTSKKMCLDWYKPNTKWPCPKINWCQLNTYYSFNKEKLLKEVLEIKKQFKLKPFPLTKNKKMYTYRGICLSSKKNSQDPLYEGLKIFNQKKNLDLLETIKNINKGEDPGLYEKDFTEKTEIYKGYLKKVLNKFKSIKSKIRILELKRGGVIVPHVDFPYYKHIRIHTVLQTNKQAFWSVGGETFQIPADGHWYWIDVGKNHSVWNYGKEDRIVLSLNLSIYENKKFYKIENLIISKDL